jgi:hypothetical protein
MREGFWRGLIPTGFGAEVLEDVAFGEFKGEGEGFEGGVGVGRH